MSRVPRVPVQPDNPLSVAEQQREIIETLDNRVEFGEPLDPNDVTSVVLAGGTGATAHNGIRSNILGSWVELEVEALDTAIACNHNLYLEQPGGYTTEPVAGSPNVRWFVVGWQHDGTKKTLWSVVSVPTSAAKAGATASPLWGSVTAAAPFDTIDIYWFQPNPVLANEDRLFSTVQMPNDWKEGTDITAHVHWVAEQDAAGASQVVRWGMEYSWADMGDVFPASTTIYNDSTDFTTATVQSTQLVQNTHYVSEYSSTISGTGHTVGSSLAFRLFRNSSHAEDTYTDDAGLLEVAFHYQVDGWGSDAVVAKTADVEYEWCPFNIMYNSADSAALTANSIPLRVYAAPGLDVSSSHKLKVTLFFIKATR
jgi:hypothetical protein